MAYLWRKLTPREREEILERRKFFGRPWHRPPHFEFGERRTFLLTAACYEHKPIIGHSAERMAAFSESLFEALGTDPVAWCVLPNHYHVLIATDNLKSLLREFGRLHGRTSRAWNEEDDTTGRKVWHGLSDRVMRSNGHLWASINYIHHNPVKHGYAEKWAEWPFSSAKSYLESEGREQARAVWQQYPLGDYEQLDTSAKPAITGLRASNARRALRAACRW